MSILRFRFKTILIVCATVFVGAGCSTLKTSNNHVLVAQQNIYVTNVKGETQALKKDEKLELKDKNPVLVEAPGRVSIIVSPPTSEPQEISLRLRKISDWGGPQLETIVDNILSDSLEELYSVQVLLGSGKAQEALVKIRELRQRYPNISYLQLVEISCLKATGQKSKADALSETLKSKKTLPTEESKPNRSEASQ